MCESQDAPWRSESLLRQKYIGQGLSTRELAELWDCSRSTIGNWLERFDIPKDNTHMSSKPWQDKERLEQLYIQEGLTAPEIGERLGCSSATADKWLKRLEVSRKYMDYEWCFERFVEEDKTIKEMARLAGCSHRTISDWLHKHDILPKHGDASYAGDKPWQDPEKLKELYHGEELSARRVAEQLACSEQTVRHWLIQFDIPRRSCGYTTVETYRTTKRKYPVISGDGESVLLHRFLAFACGKMTFEQLCDPDYVVHHRTNTPWDNRPENLEVMTRSEHLSLHNQGDYEPEEV